MRDHVSRHLADDNCRRPQLRGLVSLASCMSAWRELLALNGELYAFWSYTCVVIHQLCDAGSGNVRSDARFVSDPPLWRRLITSSGRTLCMSGVLIRLIPLNDIWAVDTGTASKFNLNFVNFVNFVGLMYALDMLLIKATYLLTYLLTLRFVNLWCTHNRWWKTFENYF